MNKKLSKYQVYVAGMDCPFEVTDYNKRDAYAKMKEYLKDRPIKFCIRDVYKVHN